MGSGAYQALTPREHARRRPETYIGSVKPHLRPQLVANPADSGRLGISLDSIRIAPGLLKIADEILVNASDNCLRAAGGGRYQGTTEVHVQVDDNTGEVTVWNDGTTVPTVKHPSGSWTPELVFGTFKTGSNFDDSELRITGGRNGVGAKATNVFSTSFEVECADGVEGRRLLRLQWEDGMQRCRVTREEKYQGESYTSVTFLPEWGLFGSEGPPEGYCGVVRRRALELAACCPELSVKVDDKPVGVKSLGDYGRLLYSALPPAPEVEEQCGWPEPRWVEWEDRKGNRWEAGVGPQLGLPMSVSFANAVATPRGGVHVATVEREIARRLSVLLRGRGISAATEGWVRRQLTVFVSCRVINPAFDAQTKDMLKEYSGNDRQNVGFDDHVVRLIPLDVDDPVTEGYLDFLAERWRQKIATETEEDAAPIPLKGGLPDKLDDAKHAGGIRGHECTLIIAEGDSAKALAKAGLSEAPVPEGEPATNYYGVYPLGGKFMQVERHKKEKVSRSQKTTDIMRALGLQWEKKYATDEERRTLRYGKVLLMCDQDPDGAHIKALFVNLIHAYWPALLHSEDFVYLMATPLVKVWTSAAGTPLSFYSLQCYEKWKKSNLKKQVRVKYYKGLGTSTAVEGREYFAALNGDPPLQRLLQWQDAEYDGAKPGRAAEDALQLQFSEKRADDRKDWLIKPPAPPVPLGDPLTVRGFIYSEGATYGREANMRAIPSVLDGLKVGQRKVLYGVFRHFAGANAPKEVKVAQLAASVAHTAGYAHGEHSLNEAIVRMAQDYVGSGNNIPLIEPNGMFGSRLEGGSDHASARYIFTRPSPLARLLFPPEDDDYLPRWDESELSNEPRHYVPILPVVLINAVSGIGVGWNTSSTSYDPLQVLEHVRWWIGGREKSKQPPPLVPWHRGHRGAVVPKKGNDERFLSCGAAVWVKGASRRMHITELPVGQWTRNYRAHLDKLKKQKRLLRYTDDCTDTDIDVNVELTEKGCKKVHDNPLDVPILHLTALLPDNLVLHSSCGSIRRYTTEEVFKEHHRERLQLYETRLREQREGAERKEQEARRRLDAVRWLIEEAPKIRVARDADMALTEYAKDRTVEDKEAMQTVLRKITAGDMIKGLCAEKEQKAVDKAKAEVQDLTKTTAEDLWKNDLQRFEDEYRKLGYDKEGATVQNSNRVRGQQGEAAGERDPAAPAKGAPVTKTKEATSKAETKPAAPKKPAKKAAVKKPTKPAVKKPAKPAAAAAKKAVKKAVKKPAAKKAVKKPAVKKLAVKKVAKTAAKKAVKKASAKKR